MRQDTALKNVLADESVNPLSAQQLALERGDRGPEQRCPSGVELVIFGRQEDDRHIDCEPAMRFGARRGGVCVSHLSMFKLKSQRHGRIDA